jgi:hypothetical protein
MFKRIVQRLRSLRFQAPLIVVALLLALWTSGSAGANTRGAPAAPESPPAVLNYQGVVKVDGELFDGTGHFKFAIAATAPPTTGPTTAPPAASRGPVSPCRSAAACSTCCWATPAWTA